MRLVGYANLQASLHMALPPVAYPAMVRPVTRVHRDAAGLLAVPESVAPVGDAPLDHVLFALKHEGVDLAVLSQALLHISSAEILAAVNHAPSGRFVRKAGYLWEHFNRVNLGPLPVVGNYVGLFDPADYVVMPGRRDRRWRIFFNGIGSLDWCATVRRTPLLRTAMAGGLLQRASAFAEQIDRPLLDRAMEWAYLSETESSFAIEREAPTADKAQAFRRLLTSAGQPGAVNEALLTDWQNAAITNPLEQAGGYRHQQNWLQSSARGAAGVTYVPPPPPLARQLMDELLNLVNSLPTATGLDPLVLAAVVSFGFVFIHPYMDGNGRLSRFLVHRVLAQSGELPPGLLLPVSIAMKRHEDRYLAALQAYSRPLRGLWDVRWIDEGHYHLHQRCPDAAYRYWDATPAAEFLYAMADEALREDLQAETLFLSLYDRAVRAVEARFDIRANALATLVIGALQHGGKVSERRRKQFCDVVPQAAFDYIEAVARSLLQGEPEDGA